MIRSCLVGDTRALAVIVAAIMAVGCSSAPDTPETITETRDRAAEYAEFGNRYFQAGNYSQALQFFELALRENTSVDNRTGIADAYNSIGNVYLAVGDVETAESSFASAYEIAVDERDPRLLLQSATHLGEVALRRGNNDLAMERFDEARSHENAETPRSDLAILYHNVATVHSRRGDFAAAERFLLDAIAINEMERDLIELASNHYMLASVFSRQERLDDAYAQAQVALELDKQTENSVGIAADLKALGIIARRRGDLDEARDYLRRSLQVAATVGLEGEARSVLGHLVDVAVQLGLTEEAQRYREQIELLEGPEEGA